MRRPILSISIAAFLLRLVVGLILVGPQGGDALEYTRIGENIAGGHSYSLATAPPYAPTDFRLPGYPAVLAIVHLVGGSNFALVVVNSLLGAATVALLMLIASRVFAHQPALVTWTGAIAAAYPTFVTFTGVAYSENLAIPAVCAFIFVVFVWDISRPGWRWALCVGIAGAFVALTRPEGIALVVLAIFAGMCVRRPAFAVVGVTVALTAIAPVAWALRNHHTVHRFELSDPLSRDTTLLLSFNDGDVHDPLYLRGFRIGYNGTSSARARAEYHHAVTHAISNAWNARRNHVVAYKAKSLANFMFVPLVWTWSSQRDYSLSEAAQNPTARNALRLLWSVVLLVQYCLALLGLVTWWRHGERGRAIGFALYPALAWVVAIPFHSEMRLWFVAAALLIVPAVAGAASLTRARGGWHVLAGPGVHGI